MYLKEYNFEGFDNFVLEEGDYTLIIDCKSSYNLKQEIMNFEIFYKDEILIEEI